MKKILSLLFILLVLSPLRAQNDAEQTLLQPFHSISSQDILSYAAELSSDKYRGRLSGSPEYLEAAKWVAGNLADWGIEPVGDDGTFFQWFPCPYTDVKTAGAVILYGKDEDGNVISKQYRFPDEYFPASNSDSGDVTAKVVYVGHGVSALELGYDDYKNIDVTGKIVLMDTDVPAGSKDEDYASWVPYCYHQYKLNNAVKHGAAGMLYINNLANPNTCFNEGFIYAHVGKEVAADLFFGTGRDHKTVKEEIARERKPCSLELNKTVTIKAETEHHPETRGCNVAGLVRGSDPTLKNEVIIVGGHLDGQGYLGEVLPGALDNGSGCADMLGAAKALAQSAVRPRRSILFLFIGGEECGLFGSQQYTAHPLFPAEKTVCYFNLDMVGTGSGLGVYGVKSFPVIERCFQEANDRYIHRPFRTSPSRAAGVGRPRSDGVIFQKAGYRSFSFGTFYQQGEERIPMFYHHPLDRINTLNPEIMEDVAKLMYLGLLDMANQDSLFPQDT